MTSFSILLKVIITLYAPVVYGATSQQVSAILSKTCAGCHGESNYKGGLRSITELSRLIADGYIIPGKPNDSLLLNRIENGEMPPPSSNVARLSEKETSVIRDWISKGAKVTESGETREFQSLRKILGAIRSDVEKYETYLKDKGVKDYPLQYVKYFTFSHYYNAKDKEGRYVYSLSQINQFKLGLLKLLNSLNSTSSEMFTLPEVPGTLGMVLRADFLSLPISNPRSLLADTLKSQPHSGFYSLLPLAESFDDFFIIKRKLDTDHFLVRPDWFSAVVTQTKLYYDLLFFNPTLSNFDDDQRTSLYERILSQKVIRSGFVKSGVSQNNRIIERHTFLGTPEKPSFYWLSYDFKASTSVDFRNIFSSPIGPKTLNLGGGIPYEVGLPTTNPFQPDGGEIIWSLPNGLHAYALYDATSKFIVKASTDIVSDPANLDRTVTNPISCMRCHAQGYINKVDQLASFVENKPELFSVDERNFIKKVHVSPVAFRKQISEDSAIYLAALGKLGIDPSQGDPTVQMVEDFEGEVGLARLASELLIPVEKMTQVFLRDRNLDRIFGSLALGGTAKRGTVSERSSDLLRVIRDFKIGEEAIGISYKNDFGAASCEGFYNERFFPSRSAKGCIDRQSFTPSTNQYLIWKPQSPSEETRESVRRNDYRSNSDFEWSIETLGRMDVCDSLATSTGVPGWRVPTFTELQHMYRGYTPKDNPLSYSFMTKELRHYLPRGLMYACFLVKGPGIYSVPACVELEKGQGILNMSGVIQLAYEEPDDRIHVETLCVRSAPYQFD